jgi:chromosome partitioning protein
MDDGSRGSDPPIDEPMTDFATGGGSASPGDGALDSLVSGSLASDPGRSPVLERPLFHVEPESPAPLAERGSGEPSAPVDARAAGPAMASAAHPAEESDPDATSEFHVEPAAEGDRQDDADIPTPAQTSTPAAVQAPAPAPTAAAPPPPRPRRALPRILAVANQKGGVGKTTTAVNLGAALAELGYRTLVVDLDPQGNATTGLGINARSLQTSVYDVLMRELPIEDALEPTSVRNLFVVPATIDLAGAEIELVPAFSRELRLKRALDGVADDFDFTLIDCPPSLGLLTVNALAAAGEVVVPVQCEYYALEGLSALLRNVQLVQNNLNKALEVSTIILTMYDGRTKLAEQVAKEVRSHFGNVVCRNLVPRTVRLSEAPSYGQPIIVFDPTSRGAIAYRELAKEVSGGSPQRIG